MNSKTLKYLEFEKIKEVLLSYVTTMYGAEYIKDLYPSKDINFVKKLLNETTEAVNLIQKDNNPPFIGLKDIRKILKKASKESILAPQELLAITDTLRGIRVLKNFMSSIDKEKFYNIYFYSEKLIILKEIETNISKIITDEGEVSDNASKNLYSIRKEINKYNQRVREKLNSIINSGKYSKYLQENIITTRNNRFVVPVKQEYKSNFQGIVHDQSSSGATLFVEPADIVQINNSISKLKTEESKEIELILRNITKEIAMNFFVINDNIKNLGYLDFIFSKAKFSISMDSVEPLLNNNGFINIKNGKHPLLINENVVPIDIIIGKEYKALVITGPNTGGKTVTLKTLGILTLMTQSGLHIPTKWGTEIAIFDNVFADIGDEQSIEQSLSTFSSHMTNIINIIESISKNTLVLLDELGAGTDPLEGAALAKSILNYLLSKEVITVATTHYSELKSFAYLNNDIENASVEFDVKTLKPTYRLLLGLPGKSNAFEISKQLGLCNEIINNAKELLTKEDIKMEDLLSDLQVNKKEIEEKKELIYNESKKYQELKLAYENKLNRIEMHRNRVIKESKKEATKIIEQAKLEVEKIIKSMENLKLEKENNKLIENNKNKLRNIEDSLKEGLIMPIIQETKEYSDEELVAGSTVYIKSLNQKGFIVELLNENEVQVQIGQMRINVPKTAVLADKETKKNHRNNENANRFINRKAKTVLPSIDLRGLSLEDATRKLEKYIDDAYLSNLDKVTIIHGKGTGALKKGLKDNVFKNNPIIKKCKPGNISEGGEGVTIIEFK